MTRRVTAILLPGLTVTHAALASEEAHHHAAGGIPIGTLLLSTINLAIFVGILYRYAWPAVRTFVADRRTQVINDLQAAADAKADAEKLRAEWETRLAHIEQTIAEMRTQARQDAERERERILEAARKLAETIRRDAERAAAYEVRRTQQMLRAELVQHALRQAEAAARQHLTAADQQRFVAEFLKQVQA